MAPKRKDSFEVTFGTIGFSVMTVALALLLFASFMSGVIVGRNIESYPEKIARGIPSTIKDKMSAGVEGITAGQRREDVPLTFYQTLSRPEEEPPVALPPPRASRPEPAIPARESPPPPAPPAARTSPGSYTIQVAAFRDEASVERLRSRLSVLGYAPVVHESRSAEQGTWYRVRIEGFNTREAAQTEASAIESSLTGLKCLILKN